MQGGKVSPYDVQAGNVGILAKAKKHVINLEKECDTWVGKTYVIWTRLVSDVKTIQEGYQL